MDLSERIDMAGRLAAVVGLTTHPGQAAFTRYGRDDDDPEPGLGCDVNTNGVSLRLYRLSPELALAILQLIARETTQCHETKQDAGIPMAESTPEI